MAESYKLEDEAFPSFLLKSVDGSTLENVTLGSGLGLPVAASTVAKIRPPSDDRGDFAEASYLEERTLQQDSSQTSQSKQYKFALSFKEDEMDNADDFIAAHNLSDMLIKLNVDGTTSRNQGTVLCPLPTQMGSNQDEHTELQTDLSEGPLTFSQFGHTDRTDMKVGTSLYVAFTTHLQSSDCLFFCDLFLLAPSTTQKDNVQQSEAVDSDFNSSFLANEKLISMDSMNSYITDDDIDFNDLPDDELELCLNKLLPSAVERGTVDGQELPATENFQMPDVRMAATGRDSCPASDEDTEDELESARRTNRSTRAKPLPRISRQLVGESNHPSFRPGLEGGSSEDESSKPGRPCLSGIEHRRSAEGQVISAPVTGDGGVGDGSSGSEESGNRLSTIAFPTTTTDVRRGLGLVGSSAVAEDGDCARNIGTGRSNLSTCAQMGDRVGPVGTVEGGTSKSASGSQRVSPVNWSMLKDRQETHGRGGPCGFPSAAVVSDTTSEEDNYDLSTSLEPKYFCTSFHEQQGDSDDGGNECSDEEDFQQAADASDSVVYQNEEGQWVTDLAYYASFEKELDKNTTLNDGHVTAEEFASHGDALEKIIKDEEEFEKEHPFMQEEQIVAANASNTTFLMDSSWKADPRNHVLMRASQVASEFDQGDQNYLRLSLGQFFQQRSEALGCLGSSRNVDGVKRPSFGYVISSPEKREPFALLETSDFPAGEKNDSVEVGDTDQTLHADDLDKTLEVENEGMSPKERNTCQDPSNHDVVLGDECPDATLSVVNQSNMSPQNNQSKLTRSISTIASVIADASFSTNPLELAAMIMELHKKDRSCSQPSQQFAPEKVTEEQCSHLLPDVLDTVQKSTAVGDISALDMEKYLKKMDTSEQTDTSIAQSSFELSKWADNLEACRKMQSGSRVAACSANPLESESGPRQEETVAREVPTFNSISYSICHTKEHQEHAAGGNTKTETAEQSERWKSKQTANGTSAVHGRGNQQQRVTQSAELPAEANVEETQCNFRPSTAPLTHSSPSQSFAPQADGMASPSSPDGKRPCQDHSPESTCSSPSLSRLTYISRNDATTVEPTPQNHKNNCTMALSTTIIRFSPTPPVDSDAPSNQDIPDHSTKLHQVPPKHCKSLEQLPAQSSNKPEPLCGATGLICTRSQSECGCSCPGVKHIGVCASCRRQNNVPQPNVRQLTKVDSGYCSHSHIPQTSTTANPQTSERWRAVSSVASLYPGGFESIPNLKYPGLMNMMHQGDAQSLVNFQLAQQYLGSDAAINTGLYDVGATGSSLYRVSSSGVANSEPTVRQVPPTAQHLGLVCAPGSHHIPRSTQKHQDMELMAKLYSQYAPEPLVAGDLDELRVQVVVPEELQFANACCVGIASQTSLSLFNPSERWQQVSITVASLAINGDKVDSLPYQWLIVKNKTIIGPKSTEEQKVLFIPPKAGIYQCVLSVCSWPASANTQVAARATLFARRVVLVAIAQNPSIKVEGGKSGCLNFGDLPGGSSASLPLKVINTTGATVPIRLVINATAASWRCFTLSKQPVPLASEAAHMPTQTSPSVLNHVMHASHGDNPECFVVWVHFKAWQKYATSSGGLGPPDEHSARIDIEMDSPGAGHLIKSVPIRARSGTANVHAPKDLQTVCLQAPLGKCGQTTLPLKNAGNIDVQMTLKSNDDCFSVTPDELFLTTGEEQDIRLSFRPWGAKQHRESLLIIMVLPSGPQYEITLKGDVVPEEAAVIDSGLANHVPPILSNKQFVAWGGVTLGQAVQQKLVLRNNSSNATLPLRLLIRGQDQDCFQLQSLFSPEARLTRHGELSIRPREDVTVHLLFAPTRVACMLAKLEIKQSGVRTSQPGVKFTIPLSGYGGTSNIILEDQRKQADNYVATMPDVAVNGVRKACLCVRNTGSRAAFIKALVFSDVPSRSLMDPTVVSVAPSQFVLKERTQEVVTVLLKFTQREQWLCQSDTPQLATLLLFCGDEVSRQQYRRLLRSKAHVGQNVLAENSVLKNLEFDEKFLGEELIEPFDLPERPNEAHIFYGHIRKVAVLLLGGTEWEDSTELPSTSAGQDVLTGSGVTNGNMSLDVLPVRDLQGPAMKPTGSTSKTSETSHKQSESWTLRPELLVLGVPTTDAVASTNQVQIKNNTSRELSFDLSWPAHYLTITPQHGLIEPQSHLQIFITPNRSLASKTTMLPWSGQIYVQCDDQQKFIRIQIRGDLALDVSAAPADSTLSALSPQAATPLLPSGRTISKAALNTPSQLPEDLIHFSNKNINFPNTPSGETSEEHLEVENGEVEVRWYLSSFAPTYVKGVDNTSDVFRATYTAFRCSKVSGKLGVHEKMQVPITFLPRDRGDYVQFWDLECHPLSEPQQKSRIRFQVSGTGVNSGSVVGPQEGDCSLVKTEASVRARKKNSSQEDPVWRGVHSVQDLYTFPDTRTGQSSSLKVNIRNNSAHTHQLSFVNPKEPFFIKHSKYSLRSQHYLKLPVQFKPNSAGTHAGFLLIQSERGESLVIQLSGEALPSV
ncbi:centrosomal protein of 192 kDa isoform X1 [Entelurus aequoreus]|uniref:centrosomal protein of 192 kDa isoform X1 n=1 Tax=Entelurus aequoreus TaxID=161455 RepID=UPI002B1E8FA3|nr:centrosomal protein of 192 kDa isoform X1 [Entelurus aequoreus]